MASSRLTRALPYVGAAALFSYFVFAGGVPALRHDWLWPIEPALYIQRMFDLTSGWSSAGFGYADPYPTPYPIIWPLLGFGAAFGSVAALAALSACIASTILYAGMRIASRLDLPPLAGVSLGALLLFNPWPYNKLVAGHLTMMLAYAGFSLVLAELSAREISARRLAIAMALCALQIQFFIVAVAVVLSRIRSRAAIAALLVGLAVFSPAIVGLFWHSSGLLGRLFTIEWENSQSVPIADGALLLGYFPHYAESAFTVLPKIGIGLLALVAFIGGITVRNRSARLVLAGIAIAIVIASGTVGPVAPLWRWAIVRFSEVGVYREMYDLIGLVAAGYVFLAAAAAARFRVLRYALPVCAALALLGWVLAPPSRYWVSASSLPRVVIPPAVERYALMPPFQPLSSNGRGSGIDPLYAGTAFDSVPLNALLPAYPADAALAAYSERANPAPLQALGVGALVCRASLRESFGALVFYGSASAEPHCSGGVMLLPAPAPLVATVRSLPLCSLCNEPGSDQEFFADAASRPPGAYVKTLRALREHADPKAGWIDARLAFGSRPDLAQPFGGAFTEQSAGMLPIPLAPFVLADVDGTLRDQRGRLIASHTHGYRWLRLPRDASGLRCSGACAVALAGDPKGVPLNDVEEAVTALQHRIITPWLWTFTMPANSGGIVRVLQRYDSGWVAVEGSSVLPHIRVGAVMNGWNVPANRQSRQIVMLHLPSIVQLLCELLGYCAIILVIVRKWQPD